jgi:hypothetical protein
MDIRNDVLANNESKNFLPILSKGTEGSWGEITPRKLFIGGNWKSNGDTHFLNYFTDFILNEAKFSTNFMDVVVAPTDIHL